MKTIEFNGELFYSLEKCEECGEFGKDYYISKNGKILSTKYGKYRILKKLKNNNGYLVVIFYQNGKQKTLKVHRLLATVFLNDNKKIIKPLEVDHINRIRTDNRLENLRIVDHKTNIDNRNLESFSKAISKALKGKKNAIKSPIKVTNYKTGELVGIFESTYDIERNLKSVKGGKLNLGNISSVLTGRYKSHGGYFYERVSEEEYKQYINEQQVS